MRTAGASLRSFLAPLLLRKVITTSGANSFGRCPSAASVRAQKCAELHASIAMVHGGTFTAHSAKPRNPNCLKYSVRPEASAAHTTMTSFARSTPTVVISFMSSPFLMQIEAHTSILALRCRIRLTSTQGRGTPLYSLDRERSVVADPVVFGALAVAPLDVSMQSFACVFPQLAFVWPRSYAPQAALTSCRNWTAAP